jgi:nitroreductase
LNREDIDRLINDAVWVPSGSNNQPWKFVVITDPTLMKEFSDACKKEWLANLDQYPHMRQYEKSMTDPGYNVFYNAPALAIIFGNTDSYWYVYDCSMVALNLALLAEEAGLGTCWIGFAHSIFDKPEVKSRLGVPENFKLVAPVILGYPSENTPQQENPRKPFEIIHYAGSVSR